MCDYLVYYRNVYGDVKTFMCSIDNKNTDVETMKELLYNKLLLHKQEKKLNKKECVVFDPVNCGCDLEDPLGISASVAHLPSHIDAIKIKLWTLSNIKARYTIENIESIPSCMGCFNSCLNQEAHMDCNGGCLHNPDVCINCNNI